MGMETIKEESRENLSPSGDEWFDDLRNIAEIYKGIEDMEAGRVVSLSLDEIRKIISIA
jgi:hypothetical protein